MIVLKFGGTSVRDASWIDNAINITLKQIDEAPVMVSSAMARVTNGIVDILALSEEGASEKAAETAEFIKNIHLETCHEFLTGENLDKAVSQVNEHFSAFTSLVKGLSLLKECSLRSKDALLSFGERLSTLLIHHRCVERGIPSELLDSRDFIKTDENFTSAGILPELCEELIKKHVSPEKGKILIAQGFIGSTEAGVTSTLGRGGSDYTATIIGSALDAKAVQIWTDVTGIMTSDPRHIQGTQTIENITYTEAAELAYFGAKVVHPSTIQPAVKKNIPVWVKNTGDTDAWGTKITGDIQGKGLKAISGKKDITVVTINSSKMLNAYGFMRRIFSIFEEYETPVDLVSTSEVSVSITIENRTNLVEIVKELEKLGQVKTEEDKSIICMVGYQLWKDPSFIARVFGTLKDTPVRMISLGSSDTNLSFVVPLDSMNQTIQLIHDEFFP